MARAGNDFFWQFLRSIDHGYSYDCAVEVGCNDFYLTTRLAAVCRHVVGVDPQWRGKKARIEQDNVAVLGKCINEVEPTHEIPARPDLILAVHTLEHIAEPLKDLTGLIDFAADEALIVVEVPCFDTQLRLLRFDQVFHQHIQYFSVSSLIKMFGKLGCGYVKHTFNYQFWGGTLLAMFRKGQPVSEIDFMPISAVVSAKERFLARCYDTTQQLESCGSRLFAYGASQLLPTLAYHLRSDMAEFEAVLDQSPARIGKYFPGLVPQIILPNQAQGIEEAVIFITAIDSARQIMRACFDRNPRLILRPLCDI